MGRGSGKVILLGEHAVVYGKPALAASLSKGASAVARPADAASLRVAPWGTRVVAGQVAADADQDMLRRAFEALLEQYPEQARTLEVEASMEIPGGAGLGGSAALSVAVVRALDEALGLTRNVEQTAALSLQWEKVFHGNPSGVDNAMAAAAGICLFRKGEPLQQLEVACTPWLTVGHSGQSASTKQTVASVARQQQADPQKVDKILDAIEAVVMNGRRALLDGRLDTLGQLFELNQKLLNSLLLSTARLEELCQAARAAGALGAKLTGGGGGGCMIALSPNEQEAQIVCEALQAEGSEAFVVEAGA